METLFRFNVVRDARLSSEETDPIDLSADTPFQKDAAENPTGEDPRHRLKALAEAFVESPEFVGTLGDRPRLERLERVSAAVDELIEKGAASRAEVGPRLETILGASPSAFLSSPDLGPEIDALKDSMLAIKLLPAEHHRPLRRLAAVLRAYYLLRRFVDDPEFPANPAELTSAQRRPMRLPEALLPQKPPPPTRPTPPDVEGQLKGLADVYERLDGAIRELKDVRPGGYTTVTPRASGAVLPPEKLRPVALFQEELSIRREALRATLLAAGRAVDGGAPREREVPGDGAEALAAATLAAPYLRSSKLLAETPAVGLAPGAHVALTGRPDFEPLMPGLVGLRLSREAQSSLSEGTRKILGELGLEAGEPVARTLQKLEVERRHVFEQAQALVQPVVQKTFHRIGNTTVAISTNPLPAVYALPPKALVEILPKLPHDLTAGVPVTHADIKPSGIMDLLLVRQHLKGYEAAEVSHIANVLRGETRDRVHRTRLETETITTTEVERTVETENELETTDRFEMRRESEIALMEETSVKNSLAVKGKYGPSVEFQASGEASWQRRRQETERATHEVAREVTQRASEKITERMLRRETLRVNRQIEETNQHTFDNREGTDHINGVYQWVTKVYEAQVYNYGPRVVYDIMIPEPGAFLLEAFRRRRTAAVELEKPPPFDIGPDQLTEDNYTGYVALYGATDVKPPPEPFVMESYDFNTGGEDKNQEFTNSTRIAIPDGYQAVRATVGIVATVWDNWCVDVVIGQRGQRFSGGFWIWPTDLDEETGSVPFALVTDKVGDVAVAVEVICEATERARDLWRAQTHTQLVNAYRTRLSEYEAKRAELEAQAPAEIPYGSSARNRFLMVDEVKRACVSVLTEQHFDLFRAIDIDPEGLPRIDFNENALEGAYVRFFEQAFEWENLSWVAYPYFWGRKSTWLDRLAIEDDDPDFQSFLRAGYLRVQIPIRPGFVDAVDHFRLYGEPWQGGPLPALSDDMYLPIAEELAEKLGRPGDEVPVGEPWEVRVPTSLVLLRTDDQLPRWEKQPDGSWQEV